MDILDHSDIMTFHDNAFIFSQNNRNKASDDLIFARLTQWDDSLLNDILTQYRGEFNIIRKERRRALREMKENPVQIEFHADGEQFEEEAETLNGYYRKFHQNNRSQSAVKTGFQDCVDCGFGAWEYTTEYKDDYSTIENKQVPIRKLIHEANNVVFYDPNAKERDKSDAMFCSKINTYSEDGWEQERKRLGLSEEKASMPSNFATPNESFVYPWSTTEQVVRIGEFYYKQEVDEKYYLFQNSFGQVQSLTKSEVQEQMESLLDNNYNYVGEKKAKKIVIHKYLVSGEAILKGPETIPCSYIPIIPIYGEWSFVEGEEIYEGITRLAKDPQRLHNFQMSFLADLVSKGPVKKPFFYPEQIKGREYMYDKPSPENNYPYYLLNSVTPTGRELPPQPVGYMEQAEVPQAMANLLQLTRESMNDTIGPSLTPENMDPSNTSGKAIKTLYKRADTQLIDFQDSLRHALHYDAKVFQSLVSNIMDTNQEITIMNEMNQDNRVSVNNPMYDIKTGQNKIQNNMTKGSFDVYTTIGPNYNTQKEETKEHLKEMFNSAIGQDPQLARITYLQFIALSEGLDMKYLRDWASKQLLIMGIVPPKNQQEAMEVKQAQQQQQKPSPEQQAKMMETQAKMKEADARQMEAKGRYIRDLELGGKTRAEIVKLLADANKSRLEGFAKTAETLTNLSPTLQLMKSKRTERSTSG